MRTAMYVVVGTYRTDPILGSRLIYYFAPNTVRCYYDLALSQMRMETRFFSNV